MYFDFPIIPAFPWLKIDLSEVPALMGGFAYGPITGGIIVILKVFLRLFILFSSFSIIFSQSKFSSFSIVQSK